MKNSTEKTVLALTEELAEQMGVYVVDVESKKENGQRFLRIYIDKQGGVGLDDCEAFSRAVEPILDENDPIAEAYSLEVSSPGVERQLKEDREFEYYIGRKVSVKLYKAVDGKKEFDGILKDYKDKTAFIENDIGTVEVKKEEAVYIKLFFEV